jgi:hypothetical protein
MPINWEAVMGMCALIGIISAVVRFSVKSALAEFKEQLRLEFANKEWAAEVDRRLVRLEENR